MKTFAILMLAAMVMIYILSNRSFSRSIRAADPREKLTFLILAVYHMLCAIALGIFSTGAYIITKG